MTRKTSSRHSKVPKRPRDKTKKRGKENGDTLTAGSKDCKGHEPDCQCYLRRGVFLPPGVEPDAVDLQDSRDNS